MQTPPIASVSGWAVPTNPAVINSAGKLTNTTGTLLDFTFAGQALMPNTSPDGSAFFKVTNTSGAPTNLAAPPGALAFDSVGSQLYYFNGVSWVAVGVAGATTWSGVLTAGNTSGANDAVMSAGQQLRFVSGIRVGGNGVNAGLAAAGGVAIGGAATATGATSIALGDSSSATGSNAVAIGFSASAGFANSVAIGAGVATTTANQIALGQAATTVAIAGRLAMPSGAVVGTTSLLSVTSVPGTPTSVGVAPGSLVLDDTNKLLYVFTTASGWQTVGAAPPTPTLSAVLTAGNTTGANNISVNSGQQLTYAAGVKIGGNGAVTGTTSATGVTIGNASTAANALNALAIGNAAVAGTGDGNISIGSGATNGSGTNGITLGTNAVCSASGIDGIAIGNGATITGGATSRNNIAIGTGVTLTNANPIDQIGIGRLVNCSVAGCISIGSASSATATNAVAYGFACVSAGARGTCIGTQSSIGSGADNTVVGSLSSTLTTCATSVVVGSTNQVGAGCDRVVMLGTNMSTSAAVVSNSVFINTNGNCQGSNSVKIGDGTQGTGASIVAIGPAITVTGTASASIAIGGTLTIPTAVTNVIAIGHSQTIGASCTNSVALGASAVINSTNQVVVGKSATGGSGTGTVSIGASATVAGTATTTVVIGANAVSSQNQTVCIGESALCGSLSGVVVGQSSNINSSSANSIIVGRGSTVPTASTDNIILGSGSTISTAAARVILLGNALTVSPAADSMYTTTTWAASAAGTTISWDAATGRIHPNTSSIRYKQDLQPIKEPSRILKVETWNYALKEGYCGCGNRNCDGVCCGRREIGAIAEQVEQVIPELVSYSIDPETRRSRPESVFYDRMSIYLLEIIKQQQQSIEELQAAVSKLTQ